MIIVLCTYPLRRYIRGLKLLSRNDLADSFWHARDLQPLGF